MNEELTQKLRHIQELEESSSAKEQALRDLQDKLQEMVSKDCLSA